MGVATGAVAEVPPRWMGWLKPGGRLLAIRGESPVQKVTLITHEREEALLETDLPYLVHAAPLQRFAL